MDRKKLNTEDLYPHYLHIGLKFLKQKTHITPPSHQLPYNADAWKQREKTLDLLNIRK